MIAGAADEGTLPASIGPVLTAVVGAPDGALVGGLDQRVDAFRIAGRDGHVDLAYRRFRHAVVDHALPVGPAVMRDVDTTARTVSAEFALGETAEHPIGVHHHAPRAGDESV